MIDKPRDELISVQRLYNDSHFEIIKKNNLIEEKLSEWRRVYPNHEGWLNMVINELKNQTYERIAFGGFFTDKKKNDVLCSSAIVKKNPFTPYLEIKNLISFKYKDESDFANLDLIYKDQIIKHIKGYAEQRGFPKLVAELVNRDRKDKDLIKIFLENDFVIAGNHVNRYQDNDDIVYLIAEINPIYGYDPYDNLNMSAWILSKYLNCNELKKSNQKEVSLLDYDKYGSKPLKKNYYTFFRGRSYFDDEEIKTKFNLRERVIVLEEYLTSNSKLSNLKNITYMSDYPGRSYVFDYTKSRISSSLNSLNHIVFQKDEINSLTGFSKKPNLQYRFEFDKVGGFLLISNPNKFPLDRLKHNMEKEISSIYLKLGSVGKYINVEMPLVFAYYPDRSSKSTLQIWGTAWLNISPDVVDIKKLREQSIKNYGHKDGLTNADHLFRKLKEDMDASPLWNRKEFDQHNSYNATDTVICYPFEELKVLDKDARLDLSNFLDDPEYLEDLEKVFDFYLSKDEISKIIEEVYRSENIKDKLNMSTEIIPLNFKHAMEQQVAKEYKKIIRHRSLKSDALDEGEKKGYQKEIDNSNQNIIEIQQTFLRQVKNSNPQETEETILDAIKGITSNLENRLDTIREKINSLEMNVNLLVQSVDDKELEENMEVKSMADELILKLTPLLSKHDLLSKETKEQLSSKISTGAKLKLTIPIIPGLLKIETELLSFSASEKIKGWKDLWKGIFKKD